MQVKGNENDRKIVNVISSTPQAEKFHQRLVGMRDKTNFAWMK